MAETGDQLVAGIVVKLDRGFPLVRIKGGQPPFNDNSLDSSRTVSDDLLRCEHATALVKGAQERAVIGDRVQVRMNDTHDKGIIVGIEPRTTQFVRRDPAARTSKQVLAANFTLVIIAEPIADLNYRRLERELVLAHQTGAKVMVVLTKSDLLDASQCQQVVQKVSDLAGNLIEVLAVSLDDEASIDQMRHRIAAGQIAILIGKSGVGKSSLVNALAGSDVQQTATVRTADGKGRHTTVDRVLVDIPGGGAVVGMPGVRGLGVWEADQGLSAAFADIETLAAQCRFRDCSHVDEPGCAVLAAVEGGTLHPARVASYRTIAAELAQVRAQRTEALRARGQKHSTRKK